MTNKYEGWTRYHIMARGNNWRFIREGMKRSIMTSKDRNEVLKKALYQVSWKGGLLLIHKRDGSVDFIVDNWIG